MELVLSQPQHKTCGALLLVAGCSIGAGMIGLPVVSATAGFFPSLLVMLVCYLFTTATGLLLVEAVLWFQDKVNLLSIAEATLGRFGKWITFLLFFFLFHSLFVAYADGAGRILSAALPVPEIYCSLLTLFGLGALVIGGTFLVDRINRLLMMALLGLYLLLISIGLFHLEPENLLYANLSSTVATIPVILICFGYQNLVPTLVHYLKRELSAIRWAIILGNGLSFLLHLLWNLAILGMVSPFVLSAGAGGSVDMVTSLLERAASAPLVLLVVHLFSLLAIATSFLPNGITFIDFLEDGLLSFSLTPKERRMIALGFLFVPPAFCTLFFPHLFLTALSFAGGIVDVALFGLLPVAIVYAGRYHRGLSSSSAYQVTGGKGLLAAIALLSLFLFAITR